MLRRHAVPAPEQVRPIEPAETEKCTNPPASLDPPKLAYTMKEVRKLIGIGRSTLYAAIGANEIRAVKYGRRTLILAKDLHAWLEKLPQLERR
jgi:excisionase family DNA binding protein